MTTPVLIDTTPGRKTMSFVLPKDTASHGPPKPAASGIRIGSMEAGRFAALRFGGRR